MFNVIDMQSFEVIFIIFNGILFFIYLRRRQYWCRWLQYNQQKETSKTESFEPA